MDIFAPRPRGLATINRKCPPPLFGYLFKYLQVVMSSLTGRGREGFPASIRGGLWVSQICSFWAKFVSICGGLEFLESTVALEKTKHLGVVTVVQVDWYLISPLPKPTYILIYHDLFLRAQKCSITLRPPAFPQGRTASPRSAPLLWVPEGPGATHIGICAREQTMSRLTSPSLDL